MPLHDAYRHQGTGPVYELKDVCWIIVVTLSYLILHPSLMEGGGYGIL